MRKKPDLRQCFARPRPFGKRLAVMCLGLVIQGLGLAILRSIDMGVDPCSCLTQGVSRLTRLSFGTSQVLCHLVTFAAVLFTEPGRIGFGTAGNMFFLGYISDFFTWVFGFLPGGFLGNTAVRVVLLLPGLAGLLFGAAVYMCSGLGASPYDAAPFIIAGHTKKLSFRVVRMLWDLGFMAAGFALGGSVGIVTVAVALFCGPVVAFVQGRLERGIFSRDQEEKSRS